MSETPGWGDLDPADIQELQDLGDQIVAESYETPEYRFVARVNSLPELRLRGSTEWCVVTSRVAEYTLQPLSKTDTGVLCTVVRIDNQGSTQRSLAVVRGSVVCSPSMDEMNGEQLKMLIKSLRDPSPAKLANGYQYRGSHVYVTPNICQGGHLILHPAFESMTDAAALLGLKKRKHHRGMSLLSTVVDGEERTFIVDSTPTLSRSPIDDAMIKSRKPVRGHMGMISLGDIASDASGEPIW